MKDPHNRTPFAINLHKAMTARGMNASDLATRVWGKETDVNGYVKAKNRDRISVYLKGQCLPSKENLAKIAKVLGVNSVALEPDPTKKIGRPVPDVHYVVMADNPRVAKIRLDMQLPTEIALEIARLVAKARQEQEDRNRHAIAQAAEGMEPTVVNRAR